MNEWIWDDDLKKRAMEDLLVKSEGIFLWASLAIENLACFSSGYDFDKFLRKSPLGLKKVYREMLGTLISRGESGEVLNMIWSVALALRPLTFGELGYILACMGGNASKEQQPYERVVASSEIRPWSEKEIRMYVQSSMGFLRATDTTVSIFHHTAIEFLFDENRKDNLPVLSKSEADLRISWECFQYLHHAFGDPERLPRGDVDGNRRRSSDSSSGQGYKEQEPRKTPWEIARGDPQAAVDKWPYLRYAAESWFIHARRSIEISKDEFCNDSAHNWLQYQFFETSDAIRKPWIELCGDPKMQILAGEQMPLHVAVCLGLMPLVENAIRYFTKATNTDQSPLRLAIKFMSRTALGKRFATRDRSTRSDEINKKNDLGDTPLHLAFRFHHPEIVELLVKEGADPIIKNNAQLTASELGAKLEREEILDILKQDEKKRAEAKKEVLKEETKKVMEDLMGEPVEETMQKPTGESMEETAKETIEESVEDAVEELAGESVEETREELVAELMEETAEESVEELADRAQGGFWSGMANSQASPQTSPWAPLEAPLEAPLQAFPRAFPQASPEVPLWAPPEVPPWGKMDIRYCTRWPRYMGLDWLIGNKFWNT